MNIKLFLICTLYFTLLPTAIYAGAFIFAGEQNGVDLITHPQGYTGSEDQITVRVCIVPGSPNANEMESPIQNAVATFNNLTATTGNLSLGANNNIPANTFDFESVVLHEMGHCIGLEHPNLASESGLNGDNQNYTKSLTGNDGSYDLNDGGDNVIGSDDDLRGDDVNLHWFRIANNDPFNTSLPSQIDADTWSRNLNDLPGIDTFAANGDRDVSQEMGYPLTEAVMQQGTNSDEVQRTLAADDVATLRLAMSGLDENFGTADDYDVNLQYAGITTNNCDINVSFNNNQASIAACQTGGVFLNGTHVAIDTANIFFNTNPNWVFDDTTNTPPVANVDYYQTTKNTQLVVNAPGVMSNDTDIDNDDLTIANAIHGDHGSYSIFADGSFTFTPDNNYVGSDSFSYRLTDGQALSNYTTVNITVVDTNTPPVANVDYYQTTKNTQLVVNAPGVMSNDTDIDNDDLTMANAIHGDHGSYSIFADGSFTFTPHNNYVGSDSFSYRLTDGQAFSNYTTVNITVLPDNDLIFADDFE